MIWQQTAFFSETLKRNQELYAFFPQGEAPAAGWPFILMIHGLGGSHQSWQRYTSLERYAESYGVAIICPDAGRSFYNNNAYGNYWDFFRNELWRLIHSLWRLSSQREEVTVCGLSMGGFGAMKLGFNMPRRFGSVVTLSGIADMTRFELTENTKEYYFFKDELSRIFDRETLKGSENDLPFLIKKLKEEGEALPRLYMSCGTEDFLITAHRRTSAWLNHIGYQHTARETAGSHNWRYWDSELQWLFANYFNFERLEHSNREEAPES